ncbi:Alpha-mannosidase 2 [Orchesella cincta]|uniref:Alpha-mannosidase 2 n=1 Tax=Orchesella cincta TaxID=48709 RepID=A0A1D2MAF3_ORCCI|nr:Alpha-mannosidase 2 [Orchesella cincta]
MKWIHRYIAVVLLLSCSIVIYGFSVRRSRDGGTLSMATYWRQQLLPQKNGTENVKNPVCPAPDVDTTSTFSQMNFQATWINKHYFWHSEDFDFETRYKTHLREVARNKNIIKVFILPHSHNDPGWRRSYDEYFLAQTRHTLHNMVDKLASLPKMTFIWSEITYLAKWWKTITPKTKQQFIRLLEEGRLEIGTGGWVMPDEGVATLFSLVHELTEGQQWVQNHLNTHPKYSWAIDPFGHSSTYSHLLQNANMDGMVIQRLHYMWKHWLAEHKTEEFQWRPRWDTTGKFDITCLTLPYDLYSFKHACGPEPAVCLKFDFRKIAFEYGENHGKMTPITKTNVKKLAQEIVTQYHKTASLTNHNVVLVPLGDDFRYDRSIEWDQQYSNYMELFSYINSNKDKFRMEIGFGTLRDYFEAANAMSSKRASLSGDFFPYADVYVWGKPSYWTGFYGTRPYWKRFYREVENELRTAEMLFTFANALARQSNRTNYIELLANQYHNLVTARHEFAVFAHHDGVTGTSKYLTMEDYGNRLYSAYIKTISLQFKSMDVIYDVTLKKTLPSISKGFLRERFDLLPSKIPLEVFANDEYVTRVILFNSLGWKRTELVKVLVKDANVKVTDSEGKHIPSQINPVFQFDSLQVQVHISNRTYELVFLASLEPLAFSTFNVRHRSKDDDNVSILATVYCTNCAQPHESRFTIDTLPQFFQTVKPSSILRIQGPVMSQVTSLHSSKYETIQVNTTLFNLSTTSSSSSILVETYVDFTQDYSNKAEVFMRLDSELNSTTTQKTKNGEEEEVSVMFTDQNSFIMEKRVQVPSIGYEGNTYPITNMVYIQDELKKLRLSVLCDRSHGFFTKRGRLETLIERRNTFDDGRGMSEGVLDSKPTVSSYLLLLENLDKNYAGDKSDTFSQYQPSIYGHTASLKLNYPQSTNDSVVNDENPNDMALMNLQYLVDYKSVIGSCKNTSAKEKDQKHHCTTTSVLESISYFSQLDISKIIPTSLTGLADHAEIDSTKSDKNAKCSNSLLHNFKLIF